MAKKATKKTTKSTAKPKRIPIKPLAKKKTPRKAVKKTTKKAAKSSKPIISDHVLMPKHTKLSDTDKQKLFEKYHVTQKEMPKVLISDPAVLSLDVKEGDVVEITRPSQTAGEVKFYRCVANE